MSTLVKLLLLADSDLGAKGAKVEVAADIASAAITAGTAEELKETKGKASGTKVRLLIDCEHGQANAVVTLGADEAAAAVKAGVADNSAAAVKYAESLAKAAAKSE